MNGDVNGTMEEPMESSLPASPVNNEAHQKVTSDDCDIETNHCEDSSNLETSNHVDSETQGCTTDNGVDENSISEKEQDLICDYETDPLQDDNDQEKTSNAIENHCGNSNESFSESNNSFPDKSEASELQDHLQEGQVEEKCTKDSGSEKPEASTQVKSYFLVIISIL